MPQEGDKKRTVKKKKEKKIEADNLRNPSVNATRDPREREIDKKGTGRMILSSVI